MTLKTQPRRVGEEVDSARDPVHIRQFAAITNAANHVLILQHGATPHLPERWSLPGGKLIATERALQGISRECNEETGFIPRLVREVLPYCVEDELWLFYRGYAQDPCIHLSAEHVAYSWSPVDDLRRLHFRNPLMPAAVRRLLTTKFPHDASSS